MHITKVTEHTFLLKMYLLFPAYSVDETDPLMTGKFQGSVNLILT